VRAEISISDYTLQFGKQTILVAKKEKKTKQIFSSPTLASSSPPPAMAATLFPSLTIAIFSNFGKLAPRHLLQLR
jgi:hypothetical protein